ncbi:MAG TPA: GAF domain-containing protein, partial [Thermodesulfobacteriota bacterium]|nr:GAF domain-containing protein [Thermodesulfobacteriota bacterium]
MIGFLEVIFFRGRVVLLATLALVTVVLGYEATKLRMDAGFYKGMPTSHPYIETFLEYQDRLFGANRVIIVLRNTKGDIWNQKFLKTLNDITQDIFYLPGVDRRTVTSLWTPNTRILEITEDGINARDVIPGTTTPEEMQGPAIKQLRNDVLKGNLVGRLVSNDFTAAMVVTELLEYDPTTQQRLDYIALGEELETKIVFGIEDSQPENIKSSIRIKSGEGIAGTVLKTGTSLIVNQGHKDPLFKSFDSTSVQERSIKNLISVPLKIKDRVTGVINGTNKLGDETFSEEDQRLLEALAQ